MAGMLFAWLGMTSCSGKGQPSGGLGWSRWRGRRGRVAHERNGRFKIRMTRMEASIWQKESKASTKLGGRPFWGTVRPLGGSAGLASLRLVVVDQGFDDPLLLDESEFRVDRQC